MILLRSVFIFAIVAVAMIGVMVPSVFAESTYVIEPAIGSAESESEVLSIGISVIMLNLGMYLGIPAIVVVGIRKSIF